MIDKYLEIIKSYYGDKKANRSGVPYINHITEGLEILERIGATNNAMCAFCIHPIFQDDSDVVKNISYIDKIDKMVLFLVMEYRNVANRSLLHHNIRSASDIYLSPITDVNYMLIADKVQNRKDFLLYHIYDKKNVELNDYFNYWLEALGISEEKYNNLTHGL
jgi:(p)ppGpp synthase/HD superfamily hydrolase